MFTFGDVLIINFPFTDGTGSKRRPVLVIKETDDKDLLIAKITSQAYYTEFDMAVTEWQKAGLLSASLIRLHKIQTIHSSLVFGHIGRLTLADLKSAKKVIVNLVRSL
jgi:mRNA interferase MazF